MMMEKELELIEHRPRPKPTSAITDGDRGQFVPASAV
jgi:hypothetical protein